MFAPTIVQSQHMGHLVLNGDGQPGATNNRRRHKTMAYAITSAASVAGRQDKGLVARLRDGWQRRQTYKRTLRELNALTTRELADLGLTRSMLTRVAMEAAYGKAAQ
jgi:uncharacterized protein YjiS (DUF1127 family)